MPSMLLAVLCLRKQIQRREPAWVGLWLHVDCLEERRQQGGAVLVIPSLSPSNMPSMGTVADQIGQLVLN